MTCQQHSPTRLRTYPNGNTTCLDCAAHRNRLYRARGRVPNTPTSDRADAAVADADLALQELREATGLASRGTAREQRV